MIRYVFLINSICLFSQSLLNNKYSKCTKALDNGACKIYTFNKNGTFQDDYSGGFSDYTNGSGHYKIIKDSLILNYDTSELKTNDYHKASVFVNNKDSVTVFIKLYDQDKNILKNEAVLASSSGLLKRTDEQGEVIFKFKKEKVPLKLSIVSEFLPYEFSIWQNRNYEIEVFVNPHTTGIPIKNEIETYQILEHTEQYLVLKDKKSTITYMKVE